jgi:hypothetical protein
MAAKLPYLLAPGLIPKILTKIQEARRPDRFTVDFLETKLGHSGGSARAMIPLLKRLGFLASDGTPTLLYDRFRNSDTQGEAMAQALRNGFKELYDRNEYVHDLPRDKLIALVTELTGLEKANRVVSSTVATFTALKEFADFETDHPVDRSANSEEVPPEPPVRRAPPARIVDAGTGEVRLNVGYTINLNLPETTNPDVFNAIFKALKENLLR